MNSVYVVIEGAAGWITGSLALLADAASVIAGVAAHGEGEADFIKE